MAAGGQQHGGGGADQRPGYGTPAASGHRVIRRNDHPYCLLHSPVENNIVRWRWATIKILLTPIVMKMPSDATVQGC